MPGSIQDMGMAETQRGPDPDLNLFTIWDWEAMSIAANYNITGCVTIWACPKDAMSTDGSLLTPCLAKGSLASCITHGGLQEHSVSEMMPQAKASYPQAEGSRKRVPGLGTTFELLL